MEFHNNLGVVALTDEIIDVGLLEQALSHSAMSHPYLHEMATGNMPNMAWALADFARQYRGYSAAFPQLLTAVISRLESPRHRALLFENLAEESGKYDAATLSVTRAMGIDDGWIVGITHPELFERFCRSVGADGSAHPGETLESVCWREQMLNLLRTGTPAEAIGALSYGTEAIVAPMYELLLQACQHVASLEPRDTVFFLLHTEVDDGHHAALASIAADMSTTPEGRDQVAKGMLKALGLRSAFWSHLQQRAQAPERITLRPATR